MTTKQRIVRYTEFELTPLASQFWVHNIFDLRIWEWGKKIHGNKFYKLIGFI